MTRLDRLTFIYDLLKLKTADVLSIQRALQEKDTTVSIRQIQRDILDIGKHLLSENERLIPLQSESAKRAYRITTLKGKQANIKKSHIDWYFLGKAIQPQIIALNSPSDIKYLEKQFSSSLDTDLGLTPEKVVNSHFYEGLPNDVFKINIENILYAIANNKHISIGEVFADYTSTGTLGKLPNFIPSSIVFHRGNLHVAGVAIKGKSKKVMAFEIGQLRKVQVLATSFNPKKIHELVLTDLKNRFGISQNIDEKTYSIILEFTPLLGDFIKNQYWHHSQRFTEKPNVLQMQLTCGINRELVGWLFQWMSNVRIIEPPELIHLYTQQLDMINANVSYKRRFVYSNIFLKKS